MGFTSKPIFKKKKIVTLNFLHKKNFSMLFAVLEMKLVTVAETIG